MPTTPPPSNVSAGLTPAKATVTSASQTSKTMTRNQVDPAISKALHELGQPPIPLSEFLHTYFNLALDVDGPPRLANTLADDAHFQHLRDEWMEALNVQHNDQQFAAYLQHILDCLPHPRIRVHAWGYHRKTLPKANAKRKPDLIFTLRDIAIDHIHAADVLVSGEMYPAPKPKEAVEATPSPAPAADLQTMSTGTTSDNLHAKRSAPDEDSSARSKRARISPGLKTKAVQLAGYAAEALSDGLAREHHFGLLVHGANLQMYVFTRETIQCSQAINTLDEIPMLIAVLGAIHLADAVALGLTTFAPAAEGKLCLRHPQIDWQKFDQSIAIDTLATPSLTKPIFRAYALQGRGTVVRPVEIEGYGSSAVLKIQFAPPDREQEHFFIQAGKAAGVTRLPEILAAASVPLTRPGRQQPPVEPAKHRVMRLTVMRRYERVKDDVSRDDLQKILSSVFQTHNDMATKARILHRDLSPDNTAVDPTTKEAVLLDWDLAASIVPEPHVGEPTAPHRTGKSYYIAIEMQLPVMPDGPRYAGHQERYDEESKFWTMLAFLNRGDLAGLLRIEATDDWEQFAEKKRAFLEGKVEDLPCVQNTSADLRRWTVTMSLELLEYYNAAKPLPGLKEALERSQLLLGDAAERTEARRRRYHAGLALWEERKADLARALRSVYTPKTVS
ncbi:hypothetical protein CALVIDRAFT_542214 [Calocera viscosa TUFC12733]|uniref:Protein kinase domain-containing protein n=1 Tax=Calocera viscosa (strain TUFC12733) TaxID=1330018 RepID=A0A167GVE2_CALVF|nr:hypothetical protein CALVIDRAFT_542214 [Calocera viscosa TUFC12733]